jgi:tight adherence protein B
MKPGAAVALIPLAALIVGFQTPTSPDVNFVDISNYPLIRIVFTPPEEFRDVDLDRSDVTISQEDEEIDFVLRALETEPLEVVLLLDTSGSMAGSPIAAARTAAAEFVGQLPPNSDIAVVTFGTDVEVVADFATEPEQLLAAIAGVTATGETAVYDAVIEAIRLVEEAPRNRQFVVLLSDGGDTESAATLEETADALTEIDVGFYAVALQGSEFDPAALEAMAEASNGQVVAATDASGLSVVYDDIAAELIAQYAAVLEPLHGGRSRFTLTIEGADGPSQITFEIELPADPAPDPIEDRPTTAPAGIITRTTTTVRSVTPPVVGVVSAPGFFRGAWALIIGLSALFVVFVVAFWMALKPQEQSARRRGAIDLPVGADPFTSRTGAFTRMSVRMQERIESFLDRSNRRGGVSTALESAGVALRPGEFILLVLGASATGGILGILAGNPVLALILSGSALAGGRLLLSTKARRRQAAFGDQLEGTLQLISGSLRAGYGINQAINTVAAEAQEPTATEFARIVVETRLGRDLHDALTALADRMDNRDFGWITDAIEIQQDVGGDLAEVLDTVASTIRDRNQIRRQVQALSAEGRLSAIILISLPFALAGFISITNPEYLSELTGSTAGQVLLLTGVVLMSIGVVWIRKIVKVVF